MFAFARRLAHALAYRPFQFAMLVWALILANFVSLPLPGGLWIDTHIYRNAWDNLRSGRDAYLIPDPTATAQSEGLPIYFFPPPTAAIAGGPVASLPAGDYVALAVNLLLLAAAFLITWRAIRPRGGPAMVGPQMTLVALGWLLFPPTLHLLETGNQNIVFLLGLSLMAYGLLRGAPVVTSIGLAAAVLLKPSAIVFGLPLVAARRWPEVLQAAGLVAAGVLLSIPVVGFKAWLDFANAILTGSSLMEKQGYNMSAIHVGLSGLPHLAWMVLTAVAQTLAGRLPVRTMLPASIALFLLCWPLLWFHYGVLALVAITLLAHDPRRRVGLGLSYGLLAFPWNVTWLPGAILLALTVLLPECRQRLRLLWRVQPTSEGAPARETPAVGAPAEGPAPAKTSSGS